MYFDEHIVPIRHGVKSGTVDTIRRTNAEHVTAGQKMTRKTERYNAESELVEVVKSGPTFSDIIKAVNTLNRMDGTITDRKKVSNQERDVQRLLIKEVMREAYNEPWFPDNNGEK